MNHSKLFVKHGENISLVIEVCSNPRAHRIFWIAPNFRSIKIAGRQKDISIANLMAKRIVESTIRVTCIQAELYISEFGWKDEGEYSLVAKNRYGFDGASIVVKKPRGGDGQKRQKEKESRGSISRKTNSEQISLVNASISIKYISDVTFHITIIYCFSIVRYGIFFFL